MLSIPVNVGEHHCLICPERFVASKGKIQLLKNLSINQPGPVPHLKFQIKFLGLILIFKYAFVRLTYFDSVIHNEEAWLETSSNG